MSRRKSHSTEEKHNALARLAANGGNVPFTAAQLGISTRTLYHWRLRAINIAQLQMPQSGEKSLRSMAPPLAEGDLAALQALKRQMLEDAYDLSHAVHDAIPQSTLPERVIALTRLVDRIYKLVFQLPFDDPDSDEEQEAEEIHYIFAGTESFETKS